jgi:hypothetical protein
MRFLFPEGLTWIEVDLKSYTLRCRRRVYDLSQLIPETSDPVVGHA